MPVSPLPPIHFSVGFPAGGHLLTPYSCFLNTTKPSLNLLHLRGLINEIIIFSPLMSWETTIWMYPNIRRHRYTKPQIKETVTDCQKDIIYGHY